MVGCPIHPTAKASGLSWTVLVMCAYAEFKLKENYSTFTIKGNSISVLDLLQYEVLSFNTNEDGCKVAKVKMSNSDAEKFKERGFDIQLTDNV